MHTRLDRLPARPLPGELRIVEARSRVARLQGLAGLDAIPPATALHIPRCRSVHTFAMRCALDLVWLDEQGAVVRVDHEVGPRRVKSCHRARSVLEARAGRGDAFVSAIGPVWTGGYGRK